ncbi:MAG: tRNA 4-thiouridine(8) synthase ThiI [Candidatus Bathyarchaeota archaeon]|nr:tRNA 4-thiouridine(8) synthase ThiI [Candidatus Bathyarchaeota archaeon]
MVTQPDTIIVRFSGEIGIKSEWTRRVYEKQTLQNLKLALKAQDLKPKAVVRMRGRIYLKTSEPEKTAEALSRVFGITSISPAVQTTADLEDITATAIEAAQEAMPKGSTFAVRCHRVGTHPYSSIQVCQILGEKILDSLEERSLKVNLTDPQVTLTVEVREQEAFVYAQTVQGAGGFPLGTQGKNVCLLSGGIDSPVACWLVMKRGSPTVPVYIDNEPYTDAQSREKAVDAARKLQDHAIGYLSKILIVPNGENMKAIHQTGDRYTCLLCKRLMYRIAQEIATQENAVGIVTGEAIGEQASQTMQNLYVIDQAATLYPIHRPLLGFDKNQTEAVAKKIGTYPVSTRKDAGCNAVPSKPSTQAKLEAVQEAEAKLDINSMVKTAVQNTKTIQL